MPFVTVWVDGEMKEKMDGVPIDWSLAIREAIEGILDEEARNNRLRAAELNDRIRVTVPKGYDTLGLIRVWRDRRREPLGP